jgi:hypothetical protein
LSYRPFARFSWEQFSQDLAWGKANIWKHLIGWHHQANEYRYLKKKGFGGWVGRLFLLVWETSMQKRQFFCVLFQTEHAGHLGLGSRNRRQEKHAMAMNSMDGRKQNKCDDGEQHKSDAEEYGEIHAEERENRNEIDENDDGAESGNRFISNK